MINITESKLAEMEADFKDHADLLGSDPLTEDVLALVAEVRRCWDALEPFAGAWRTYGWRSDGTPQFGPEMNPEWLRRAARILEEAKG